MKNRDLIIFCLALLSIAGSCTQRPINTIYAFEKYDLCQNPLCVLDSIEGYKSHTEKMDSYAQKVYVLIYQLAKLKCFEPIYGAEKAQQLLHYFNKRKDTKHSLEASFLLANSYKKKNRLDSVYVTVENALHLPNSTQYPAQIAQLYNIQGLAFLNRGEKKSAYEVFSKSLAIEEKLGDSIKLASDYSYLAMALPDSLSNKALELVEKGIQIDSLENNTSGVADMLPTYINLMIKDGNIQKVAPIVRKMSRMTLHMPVKKYQCLLEYYSELDDERAVKEYSDSLISLNTFYAKEIAYYHRFSSQAKKHKFKEAYNYLHKYIVANAACQSAEIDARFCKHKAQYQIDFLQHQSLKEKRNIKRKNIYTIFLLFIIVFMLISGSCFVKKMHRNVCNEMQSVKVQKADMLACRDNQIQRLEKERDDLKNSLIQYKKKYNIYKQKLDAINIMNTELELAELNRKLTMQKAVELFTKDVCIKVLKISEAKLDEKVTQTNWEELYELINDTYQNLLVRIKLHGERISDDDLKICCLVKLGISNKGISRLLHKSPSATSKVLSRMYHKLTGCDGNVELAYDWIKSM